MLWSKRYSDKYCGSYRILSVTPKRLLDTHIFEKKGSFPVKKTFWPIFLVASNITYIREHFMRVQSVLTVTVQDISFFSTGTKRSLGTNISKKRPAS